MKENEHFIKVFILTYFLIGFFYCIFEVRIIQYNLSFKENILLVSYNIFFKGWDFKIIIAIINATIGSLLMERE